MILGKIMVPEVVAGADATEHDAQVAARDLALEREIKSLLRNKLGPAPKGWRYTLLTPQHDGIAAAYKEYKKNLFVLEYLGDIYVKDDGTVILRKAGEEADAE